MLSGKVIFLVEDDPDDQVLFLDALRIVDESIVCLMASDGEEALANLKKLTTPPDIIFLDLNMPKMDGLACFDELKKSVALRGIPVVIYSTTVSKSDISKLKSLGALDVLVKASNFKDSVSVLKATLESHFIKQKVR